MASLFKRKGRRYWSIQYVDQHGQKREARGASTKRATEPIARALEDAVAKARVGAATPAELETLGIGAENLETLIGRYAGHLKATGRSGDHVKATESKVRALLEFTGWRRPEQMDAAGLERFLDDLGVSAGTQNRYIAAASAFASYMLKREHLGRHPFAVVEKRREDLAPVRPRRALTVDEAEAIVAEASRSPQVALQRRQRVRGELRTWTDRRHVPERALAYRLALLCGLRKGEVLKLTPAWFSPGPPATITIPAKAGKARREDVVVVPGSLAVDLAAMLAPLDKAECPFAKLDRIADFVKIDAEAAGVAMTDAAGDSIDFHAMRHTYVTLIGQTARPRVQQQAARHASIVTTMRYDHSVGDEVVAAAEALPAIGARGDNDPIRLGGAS